MTELLITSKKTPEENGSVVKVTPELAGWYYVGFSGSFGWRRARL